MDKDKENFSMIDEKVINIGAKYYNIDSFFCFEISYGLGGDILVLLHSRYGKEYNDILYLESKTFEDAKEEVEEELLNYKHIKYFYKKNQTLVKRGD